VVQESEDGMEGVDREGGVVFVILNLIQDLPILFQSPPLYFLAKSNKSLPNLPCFILLSVFDSFLEIRKTRYAQTVPNFYKNFIDRYSKFNIMEGATTKKSKKLQDVHFYIKSLYEKISSSYLLTQY
jgi:hypothetical protein